LAAAARTFSLLLLLLWLWLWLWLCYIIWLLVAAASVECLFWQQLFKRQRSRRAVEVCDALRLQQQRQQQKHQQKRNM
jgi:fatty acid desaturase